MSHILDNKSPEVRKYFNRVLANAKRPLRVCLWPGGECKRKPDSRAHSIQNNGALSFLERKGKCWMLEPHLGSDGRYSPKFNLISRNRASAFTGLCNPHDNELFELIDNNPMDLENQEYCFLLSIRCVLKELYASKKALKTHNLNFRDSVNLNLEERYQKSDQEAAIVSARIHESSMRIANRYAELYRQREFDGLEHYWSKIKTTPTVAVSSTFVACLPYAKKGFPMTLVIEPISSEETIVFFSWMKELSEPSNEYLRTNIIAGMADRELVISKIVLENCENFVISPEFFDTFSDRKKEVITDFFIRNFNGGMYDSNDPELMLFA